MHEYFRITHKFNPIALEYPNLIRLLVNRKSREFISRCPKCFDVKIRFFEHDAENIVNNKITLSIEGKIEQ